MSSISVLYMSMSLDGYIAGPNDEPGNPGGRSKLDLAKEAVYQASLGLSQRDQIQLCVKSIEAEDIRDANGVPFQIFYGISGNDHNFWSIGNARKVIGYAPEDNSAVRFADKIARIMRDAQGTGSTRADTGRYLHNNAWVVRGLRCWAELCRRRDASPNTAIAAARSMVSSLPRT